MALPKTPIFPHDLAPGRPLLSAPCLEQMSEETSDWHLATAGSGSSSERMSKWAVMWEAARDQETASRSRRLLNGSADD